MGPYQSKLRHKFRKLESNCKKLSLIPKFFFFFNLPYTNNNDAKTFHKRPLRSALRKRNHEKPQIGYRTEQRKKQIQK